MDMMGCVLLPLPQSSALIAPLCLMGSGRPSPQEANGSSPPPKSGRGRRWICIPLSAVGPHFPMRGGHSSGLGVEEEMSCVISGGECVVLMQPWNGP